MRDLDPEEARAIIDPALQLMIDAVHRYDGYVVQSTGDGIFALFGAPVAHEDHPQRAVHAALAARDGLRRRGDDLRRQGRAGVETRIGINTGEVVMRSVQTGGHTEYSPVGHVINLASRMQGAAPPDGIVVSEDTRRLVEGYFELRGLGPTEIKGICEPINVFEVVGVGALHGHFDLATRRGLTRFVGREREMEALKHAAEQAKGGRGQIVAAMAEPGVGKSRLYFEFKAKNQSGWMVLETFSVSHGKASAYLPIIDLLRNYFDISAGDDERKRREKVAGKITILDRSLEDTLPYLFSLLGIVENEDPLAQMDGQIRKRRTLEAIKRIVLRESLNQPLMVEFEDLHWIDEQTQELLNLLADSIGTAKILLLVNYRPEYSHQWNSKTYYTQLRLDPLGKESAEEMLSALLGDGKDLVPLKRLIIERTEGTPFFIEEIVQALFEDGVLRRNGTVKLARSMNSVKVPATVQAVLAARIDRLPAEEKELLQTLAVLGREFPLGLVQRVMLKPDDGLERKLSRLQAGEFIYEQPATGDVEYTFRHALTQEVAYNSLLAERRRIIHEQAARAIEALFGGQLEEHYSQLAHHYLRGNDAIRAHHYAHLAAEQAILHGAYAEAESIIEVALKLLEKLPEDAELWRGELALRSIQTVVERAAHGMSSRETERVIRRMCELGEKIGEKEELLRGLLALSTLHFTRGESTRGLEIARRCVNLAESVQDARLLADAHYRAGILAHQSGNLRESFAHFEDAIRHSGRADQSVSTFGFSFGTLLPAGRALTLQLLGRVGDAIQLAEEGLRHARESRRLYDLGFVLGVSSALVLCYRRQPEIVRLHTEEAVALSEENGFGEWLHLARFFHGWSLAELGHLEQGVAEMEAQIAGFRRIGGVAPQQYLIALLAQGYARMARTEEALGMLNEAVGHIECTGEKVHWSEMLRLKGEMLLMGNKPAATEAEQCFRAALEVARAQEARWWELRTTVSLARLLDQQGRRDEAHTMLADIYGWFTEGFDTADLKDAKALLDELVAGR